MRIAFITHDYPPNVSGGAGTYAGELVEALAERGHELTVFSPRVGGKPIAHQGVTHQRIPILSSIPMAPQLWLKLRRAVVRQGNFDIVHLNSCISFSPFRERIAECPQVLTLHHLVHDAIRSSGRTRLERLLNFSDETGYQMPIIERRSVRQADHIISVSHYTKRRIVEKYQVPEDRVSVVWNGVKRLSMPSEPADISTKNERETIVGPKLLFVGRLNDPRKGLDILVRALSKRRELGNTTLLIAGRGDKEPVESLARDLGVEEQLRFFGHVSDEELLSLYQLVDLCVIPSRMEGFGMSLIDAQALGKRTVASRVGALPEVAGPGTVLVEPFDPIALAEGILTALGAQAPPLNVALEFASRFTWGESARLTERAYEMALSNE